MTMLPSNSLPAKALEHDHAHRSAASYVTVAWIFIAVVLILILYRVVLMWILPLADTTESRYGEIARLTLTNGFWLMPHIDIDTPFWAKPPLSTWLAAWTMQLLGVNEFAARVPSLLASMIAAFVGLRFVIALQVRRYWLLLPILVTSPLFFLSAGAVMTDAIQMCIVVSGHYFAWRAIAASREDEDRSRFKWQMGFWLVVGIGALSKGLADWALIGLPLLFYALLERRPVTVFRTLFAWRGLALCLCICVPWYILAERSNPGFLRYFIVGEHFSRFLIPGWKGDRYGIAHQQPLGMIWVFWIAGVFPWVAAFGVELKKFLVRFNQTSSLERYLWAAVLAPLIFFTFAHNIIWTYGLTAVVPFAVLVTRRLDAMAVPSLTKVAVALMVLTTAVVAAEPIIARNVDDNSDRHLVQVFERVAPPGTPLFYRTTPAYSSSFYARSALIRLPSQLDQPLSPDDTQYTVVANKELTTNVYKRILYTGRHRSLVEE